MHIDPALFQAHIQLRCATTTAILNTCKYPGAVIDAGTTQFYFADDARIPFRPTPHFAHWCPAPGTGHAVVFAPGEKPILLRLQEADFWHDMNPEDDNFWHDAFSIQVFSKAEDLGEALKRYSGYVYVGPRTNLAQDAGLIHDAQEFCARLDWERGIKSAYEIECLRQASRIGAAGHRAAVEGFRSGASELEIFYAFLGAVQCTEFQLPYNPIIGLNEKAGTLHYEHKRHFRDGNVMLIDAGAKVNGYGSDITRTFLRRGRVPQLFGDIVQGLETIQQQLCAAVGDNVNYSQMQVACVNDIAQLLLDTGVCRGETAEGLVANGLARAFFPHGLGHMLGIQVHDVSGKQADAIGTRVNPNAKDPALRVGRNLRKDEVVTVEPGIYFIPMLLEPFRKNSSLNWKAVDELLPCGGVRIEDDVVVLDQGCRNLTREFLENDFWV